MVTRQASISIRLAAEPDATAYQALRLEALRNHPEAFTHDYDTHHEKPISYREERLLELNSENMTTSTSAIRCYQHCGFIE